MAKRRTTKADLIAALKWIAVAEQCYGSQGPAVVLAEVKRTAVEALAGKWGGVAAARSEVQQIVICGQAVRS